MNRKKELLFYTNNNDRFTPSLKRSASKYEKIQIRQKPNIAKQSKTITDRQGLEIAYRQPNGIYNFGNTIYVAGTKSLNDAFDDLKIPFHATKFTQRYSDAEKYVANPTNNISNVVGHSLGGAVALELQKNFPHVQTTTYGSPTVSIGNEPNAQRYRNAGDPVSIMDRGAKTIGSSLNPLGAHSYKNAQYTSGNSDGWLIGKTHDTPWDPKTSIFTTPPFGQQGDFKK